MIIEKMYNNGFKAKEIASTVGCHISTVYREIKRGTYDHLNSDYTYSKKYAAEFAQRDYDFKSTAKGAQLKIANNHKLAKFIEDKIIKENYSPYAVLAELSKSGKAPFCVSTLYSYIDKGIFSRLTNEHLPEKASRHKHQYNPVRPAKRPPAGASIEKREDYINDHSEFGHWEMDTVCGARNSGAALLVLTACHAV